MSSVLLLTCAMYGVTSHLLSEGSASVLIVLIVIGTEEEEVYYLPHRRHCPDMHTDMSTVTGERIIVLTVDQDLTKLFR